MEKNKQTSSINFLQVIPNSQIYTDLKQIENSLQYLIDKEHVLQGIRNSINQGYKIIPPIPPIAKHDYVIFSKGKSKKPTLGQVRFITKDGIYGIRTSTGKLIETADVSMFVKWVKP